jgi:hypothetical protein
LVAATDCTAAGKACSSGQCVSTLQGCSAGNAYLGAAAWNRDDIVMCLTETLKAPLNALSACGPGWHVCTASEFTSRNDAYTRPANVVAFSATLDDGENCRVVDTGDDPVPNNHDASADAVRAGFQGSCTGPVSTTLWGRQVNDSLGSCDKGFASNCGVMCCK